jgi:hypothetical protein
MKDKHAVDDILKEKEKKRKALFYADKLCLE